MVLVRAFVIVMVVLGALVRPAVASADTTSRQVHASVTAIARAAHAADPTTAPRPSASAVRSPHRKTLVARAVNTPPDASTRSIPRSETATAAARIAAKTRYRGRDLAEHACTRDRAAERRERAGRIRHAYDEKTSRSFILYYFGARYMDPRAALWQSADPAISESTTAADLAPSRLTPYTYSWNSPIRLEDPDGKDVVVRTLSDPLLGQRIAIRATDHAGRSHIHFQQFALRAT